VRKESASSMWEHLHLWVEERRSKCEGGYCGKRRHEGKGREGGERETRWLQMSIIT